MKHLKVNLFIIFWIVVGIIYFPIFFCAWLLHIVARVLLSIAYAGMLKWQMAKQVFSSIFRTNLGI